MITVCSLWDDVPSHAISVDTTSRSKSPFSPFTLGPVIVEPFEDRYYVSRNMENAWQFSKVYEDYDKQLPTDWLRWAKQGWDDDYAYRYPAGKGAVPEYSIHCGERLGYIEARKKIYGPLYMGAVVKTNGFVQLLKQHRNGDDIWLRDFDGYLTDDDHETVLNNPNKKMGHAFWLKHALEVFE